MKKITLLVALIASVFSLSAQTAGKVFVGPATGKSFQIGTDKSTKVVLEAVKAYNSNDSDKELSFYTEEMQKKGSEFNHKWHAYNKSLNDVPEGILPVKIPGSSDEMVILKSTEDRVANNGSKQTMHLLEVFTVNKDGKISDFEQFSSIPSTNEYGKTSGGKIFTKDENNGRSLQFSNRGEVEIMEKIVKAYNAMDVPAFVDYFAEKTTIVDFDGNKIVVNKKDLPGLFAEYKSLDWQVNTILPFKISNTDPASGIMVGSKEKRVMKDGTVWEKALVEFFGFNNDGKIDSVEQYSRGLKK